MASARDLHTATCLPDGTVMHTGGESAAYAIVGTGESYNPFLQMIAPVAGPMLNGRAGHTAVALASGFVLLSGGDDDTFAVTASSELYDPPSGPSSGGTIVATSPVAKTSMSGAKVKAGAIRISNLSGLLETVSDATVALSNPSVFASLTVESRNAGATTKTEIDLPGASMQVTFDPPIQLVPGATTELRLKGKLARFHHGQASSQTVTGLNVTDWLGAVVSIQLPADLGTVAVR
jgi:hypothetical protein